MKKPHPRAKRDETQRFRVALMQLRTEMKWTQPQLGMRLGVSRRTLTNWECGYWLPPFKQRLHVVLGLREAPPEYVLEIADALGVSTDPLVKPMLQTFEDALDGEDDESGEAPPPPPERPRPTPAALRAAVDAVVREAADALNARPNEVRAAIVRALTACDELGANLEEARAAAAASPPPT